MKSILLSLSLLLITPLAQAVVSVPSPESEQSTDASLCVQQALPKCLAKCDKDPNADINCKQTCEQDIKNQCHYNAGE